jgi:acyl carrier protein
MSQTSVNLQDKLQEIFRSVFELAPTAEVTGVRRLTEPKWDSLAHVSLVAAIESEFGIELDTADALGITSFRATELILQEKLG